MMEFDRVIAGAEAPLVQYPLRTSLTDTEIEQASDYFYAPQLQAD